MFSLSLAFPALYFGFSRPQFAPEHPNLSRRKIKTNSNPNNPGKNHLALQVGEFPRFNPSKVLLPPSSHSIPDISLSCSAWKKPRGRQLSFYLSSHTAPALPHFPNGTSLTSRPNRKIPGRDGGRSSSSGSEDLGMPGPALSLPSSIRSHPGMSQFPLRRIHRILFPALGIAAGAGKSSGITWNPERHGEFALEVQQENEANPRKVPRINAEIKEGNCFPQEKSLEMGMVRAGGALDKTLGTKPSGAEWDCRDCRDPMIPSSSGYSPIPSQFLPNSLSPAKTRLSRWRCGAFPSPPWVQGGIIPKPGVKEGKRGWIKPSSRRVCTTCPRLRANETKHLPQNQQSPPGI